MADPNGAGEEPGLRNNQDGDAENDVQIDDILGIASTGAVSRQQRNPLPSLPPMEDDPFLSSMTFAFGDGCDCGDDACGQPTGVNRKRKLTLDIPGLPPDILSTLQAQLPMVRRTQERRMIYRSLRTSPAASRTMPSASIWSLTMPSESEPLVEFGSMRTHRFVWVETVNGEDSSISSIGKGGVVGSGAETASREKLTEWTQDTVHHIPPSSTGVGWASNGALVVLKIIKLQLKDESEETSTETTFELESEGDPKVGDESELSWISRLCNIIAKLRQQSSGSLLTDADSDLIRRIIRHMEEATAASSTSNVAFRDSLDTWIP